jgi:hypothetical protein
LWLFKEEITEKRLRQKWDTVVNGLEDYMRKPHSAGSGGRIVWPRAMRLSDSRAGFIAITYRDKKEYISSSSGCSLVDQDAIMGACSRIITLWDDLFRQKQPFVLTILKRSAPTMEQPWVWKIKRMMTIPVVHSGKLVAFLGSDEQASG